MDTQILRPNGLKLMDEEIERLVRKLSTLEPSEEEYGVVNNNLKILTESRERKNDRVLSSEMLLSAAINLVGILMVLNFEKTGVITSKAISFLWRTK